MQGNREECYQRREGEMTTLQTRLRNAVFGTHFAFGHGFCRMQFEPAGRSARCSRIAFRTPSEVGQTDPYAS